MEINHTNDQLNEMTDGIFTEVLERFDHFSDLTSDEITILSAKIAAKFATYAGDAINF